MADLVLRQRIDDLLAFLVENVDREALLLKADLPARCGIQAGEVDATWTALVTEFKRRYKVKDIDMVDVAFVDHKSRLSVTAILLVKIEPDRIRTEKEKIEVVRM